MTETAPSPFKLGLSSLSFEALEQIAWFLYGDGFSHLILTGDRVLQYKLFRIRSLTIAWQSSRFCRWDACLPFIGRFPNLRELALRTLSPLHGSIELPTIEKLPSNLESLQLRFRGALDLICEAYVSHRLPVHYAKSGFRLCDHFTCLKTLIVDQETVHGELATTLSLSSLPSTLKHLYLGTNLDTCEIDANDLHNLPRELEILDLGLPKQPSGGSLWPPAIRVRTDQSHNSPNGPQYYFKIPNNNLSAGSANSMSSLPTLTRLCISAVLPEVRIDISAIAFSLRFLHIGKGTVTFYDHPLFRPGPIGRISSRSNTSLRDILPRLESLVLPVETTTSWKIFETLPLSVTRINVTFYLSEINEIVAFCRDLNERYLQGSGEDRPFAPMLLKEFRFPLASNGLLPYFSSVENLDAQGPMPVPLEQLSRKLKALTASKIYGELELLPRTLQSLHIGLLIPPTKNRVVTSGSMMSIVPKARPISGNFPRLSSLKITTTILDGELLRLLPSSLENLHVSVDSMEILEALAVMADVRNAFPRLTSLGISGPPPDDQRPTLISMDTIPTSITELLLLRSYTFPPPYSSRSLRYHPNLRHLTSLEPKDPLVILPQLPRELRHANFYLASPIDLTIPKTLEELRKLPQKLQDLRIVPPGTENYLKHVPRASLDFSMRKTLANGYRDRFGVSFWFPVSLWSNSKVFFLSENFVLSCLPRSLITLELEISNHAELYEHQKTSNAMIWLMELRLNQPIDFLKRIAISRLPALGIFLNPSNKTFQPIVAEPCLHKRYESAPPTISHWKTNYSQSRPYHQRRLTQGLPPSTNVGNKEDFVFRMMYHVWNLALWLYLDWAFPFTRNDHPLAWALKWNNWIGSVASIGVLWFRRRRAPPPPSTTDRSREMRYIAMLTVPWTVAVFATGTLASVGFGITVSRYGMLGRSFALIFAALGECIVQAVAQTLF